MPKFSDTVRAFPFPLLEDGNLSFPDGEYDPEIKVGDNCTARVHHKITAAPLLERFVNDGKAVCCCAVSVPRTGYRKLFQGDGFEQDIKWDADWVGEPPIFRPLIVCVQDVEYTLQPDRDGVHAMWDGQTVPFPKGAKIAIGSDYILLSSMHSLLSIKKDDTLGPGQMEVRENLDGGFRFDVFVAPELYLFLRREMGHEPPAKHRRSIMTHAVSTCFSILAEKYSEEDDWQSYPNLQVLAGYMERKQLTLWYEDDFKPEKAASILYPHQVPEPEDDI